MLKNHAHKWAKNPATTTTEKRKIQKKAHARASDDHQQTVVVVKGVFKAIGKNYRGNFVPRIVFSYKQRDPADLVQLGT